MEAHAIFPNEPNPPKIIKVLSLGFDDCLAHGIYRDNFLRSVARELHEDEHGTPSQQKAASNLLIDQNQEFLGVLVEEAALANANEAILFNGAMLRQNFPGDEDHAHRNGLFFYAQEPLEKKLNELAQKKQHVVFWRRDAYVTADTCGNRKPGETFHLVMKEHADRQLSFPDISRLSLLYAQIHKVAFEYQEAKIHFDFCDADFEGSKQLHAFFKNNKDLLPKNIILRLRSYSGKTPFDNNGIKIPTIPTLDELIGEGEIERDFQQGYLNLIDQSGVNSKLSGMCDLLACYTKKEDAVERLKTFKNSRILLSKNMRMKQVDGAIVETVVLHDELQELVAAINTTKSYLPKNLEVAEQFVVYQFSDSLDAVYTKVNAELTKTKNIKNISAKDVAQSDAVYAAKFFSGYLQEFNRTIKVENANEKLGRHLANLKISSEKLDKSYKLRVFKDVGKGLLISSGALILAGGVGFGIGFGVGFAIGGPAGALAVGILGGIIAAAIAAAIGGGLAAGLSGRSIFNKQRERRATEEAMKDGVRKGVDHRILGLAVA